MKKIGQKCQMFRTEKGILVETNLVKMNLGRNKFWREKSFDWKKISKKENFGQRIFFSGSKWHKFHALFVWIDLNTI